MNKFKDDPGLVHKQGEAFLAPPSKDNKINDRWEHSFKVYAAIYSGTYPKRLTEIW